MYDSPAVVRQLGRRDPRSFTTLIGLWPPYPGMRTQWFSTIFCLMKVSLVCWPRLCPIAVSLISTLGRKPLYPGMWDVVLVVPMLEKFYVWFILLEFMEIGLASFFRLQLLQRVVAICAKALHWLCVEVWSLGGVCLSWETPLRGLWFLGGLCKARFNGILVCWLPVLSSTIALGPAHPSLA